MCADDHISLQHHDHGVIVEVRGAVDDDAAIALGSVLDDGGGPQRTTTLRIGEAELSLVGWAVIERALRMSAKRGGDVRLEPDPGGTVPTRRLAREWLHALSQLSSPSSRQEPT
jgi:hypothetical protein